jgi:hypothetical protein
MLAMAEVLVFVLVAAVFVWWFRRTPMYRAHRRTGFVPSGHQYVGAATPTWHGLRHVPPLRPELRPDDDSVPVRSRRWRVGRNRRPSAASALLAERRGHRSVKVFLSERSMRRSAAKQLADRRRLAVAQDPHMRRELEPGGVMADHIRARSVGRHLRRFFSPSGYPRGRVAGRLACVYFAVTVLVIVSAIPEGNGDTLTVGLASLATLPLSMGLVAFLGDGAWMLAGLAVCALLNAFVFWVVFRGDAA